MDKFIFRKASNLCAVQINYGTVGLRPTKDKRNLGAATLDCRTAS